MSQRLTSIVPLKRKNKANAIVSIVKKTIVPIVVKKLARRARGIAGGYQIVLTRQRRASEG